MVTDTANQDHRVSNSVVTDIASQGEATQKGNLRAGDAVGRTALDHRRAPWKSDITKLKRHPPGNSLARSRKI